MLRSFIGTAIRSAVGISNYSGRISAIGATHSRFLTILTSSGRNFLPKKSLTAAATQSKFLASSDLTITQQRDVTKFSLVKGKRKTVKAVVKRFKRLDWGAWIRTHSGRHKKMFKKSAALKRRLRQHIFTNATQSWLLDKMVTSYWRRPKHYIDDPYEPYHKRDEYFATKGKTFKV